MADKIAKEVAEQEFKRMCELARVDTDENEMDEESKAAWRALKASLVKLICKGDLVVAPDGKPTYAGITFSAPTGATMMALETYPENKKIGNMAAAMCDMTGSDAGAFSRLHAKDFNVCSKICNLFLG